MIGFAALRWPQGDPGAGSMADRLCASLTGAGWQLAIDEPGWRVLVEAPAREPAVKRVGGPHRIVVGHAFDTAATMTGGVAAAVLPMGSCFEEACRAFAGRAWGAFVLLETDPAKPDSVAIFRDPIGRLDCLHWSWRTLTMVSSRAELLLPIAPPLGLAIDWAQVKTLLRFPGAACETLPLRGVTHVEAGTLAGAGAAPTAGPRLWSPAEVATRRPAPVPTLHRELPILVDACTAAWLTLIDRPVAELSGGLDSAIVAAALTGSAASRVAGWFNYHAPDPEGDERAFADAVATHLGVSLVSVPTSASGLDAALLDSLPVAARPNVAGVGLFHDPDLTDRARAVGADGLFTGHGGDALFFQFATASLATDIVRSRGAFRAQLAPLESLAHWTGETIWSLLRTATREILRGAPDLLPALPIDLTSKTSPAIPPRRCWLEDTGGLSATKRLQILNLSYARSAFPGGWSAAALPVIHPLLSQPLIDYLLPVAPLDLTEARRDRALIRRAYAGRLPDALLHRRGKGSTTQLFGRALAASTPFLRAYLLDGVVAAHDCLDLDLLDALLDPDRLMLEDSYSELFALLLMERWARVWTDRIAASAGAPHADGLGHGVPI